MPGPAHHIRIARTIPPDAPRVWWTHGLRVIVGLGVLGVVSWWLGLAATGVVLTLGTLLFLASPRVQQRLTAAAAATRDDAWVSTPVTCGGAAGLLLMDDDGMGFIEGTAYGPPSARLPWSGIQEITFEGPTSRPTKMHVSGSSAMEVTGRLPSAVFDELAKRGATVPDPD